MSDATLQADLDAIATSLEGIAASLRAAVAEDREGDDA